MWKFISSVAIVGVFVMTQALSAEEPVTEKPAAKTPAALNFKVQSLDGKEVDLSQIPRQGRAHRERGQQVRAYAAV